MADEEVIPAVQETVVREPFMERTGGAALVGLAIGAAGFVLTAAAFMY